MSSLKTLGLAAAIGLSPACEKPAEQPEPPTQEVVSACKRFRAAIAMKGVIEQMASDPAAWKLFPPSVAEAAGKDVYAEAMAAASQIEDQGACFKTINDGE